MGSIGYLFGKPLTNRAKIITLSSADAFWRPYLTNGVGPGRAAL